MNILVFTYTGAEGFEPTNGGTKTRSLTTWRRPKNTYTYKEYIFFILLCQCSLTALFPIRPPIEVD